MFSLQQNLDSLHPGASSHYPHDPRHGSAIRNRLRHGDQKGLSLTLDSQHGDVVKLFCTGRVTLYLILNNVQHTDQAVFLHE
jgi:hypothetical protein